MVLKATVRNGRLVMDEPTQLPEGTVLQLIVDQQGDMSADERAALNAFLSESWAQMEAGQEIPVQKVLEKMRKLHT